MLAAPRRARLWPIRLVGVAAVLCVAPAGAAAGFWVYTALRGQNRSDVGVTMYENHGPATLLGWLVSGVLGALGLWLVHRSPLGARALVLGLGIPWLVVCNLLLAVVTAWG